MPAFFFFTGVLLGMCCMFRLNVRGFRLLVAWGATPPSRDSMIDFIVSIRLKDTFVLEIFGLAGTVIMMIVAIQFM